MGSPTASPGDFPRWNLFRQHKEDLPDPHQDLAGRPGPVWDHVIVCDKGHPISFRTLGSGVKINRFPNTAAICRKDRLCTNFHAMQKKFGKKIFNFIPKVDREMLLSQFKEYFYLLLILSDLPPS